MSKLTQLALSLDYDLKPGSKHWKLRHQRTGYRTTLPYGTKLSFRSERNILATLRRGAKGGLA
jgi:hypothetical protein